jgi:hypothetical protein
MSGFENRFDDLSARARCGDRVAAVQLRGKLVRGLRHLVRHTLWSGDNQTKRARRIRREAAQLLAVETKGHLLEADDVIDQIAARLCDLVMTGVLAGRRPRNVIDTFSVSSEDSVAQLSCAD